MIEDDFQIVLPDNTARIIEYDEINQIKKDILWIYDQNFTQINAAYVDDQSFKLKYWQYLSISKTRNFDGDRKMILDGVLIILLCMCVEYIDTISGNQKVLDRTELPEITHYVQHFNAESHEQIKLKSNILLGLEIISSMTPSDLINHDYDHPNLQLFYSDLNGPANRIIKSYYLEKLNIDSN